MSPVETPPPLRHRRREHRPWHERNDPKRPSRHRRTLCRGEGAARPGADHARNRWVRRPAPMARLPAGPLRTRAAEVQTEQQVCARRAPRAEDRLAEEGCGSNRREPPNRQIVCADEHDCGQRGEGEPARIWSPRVRAGNRSSSQLDLPHRRRAVGIDDVQWHVAASPATDSEQMTKRRPQVGCRCWYRHPPATGDLFHVSVAPVARKSPLPIRACRRWRVWLRRRGRARVDGRVGAVQSQQMRSLMRGAGKDLSPFRRRRCHDCLVVRPGCRAETGEQVQLAGRKDERESVDRQVPVKCLCLADRTDDPAGCAGGARWRHSARARLRRPRGCPRGSGIGRRRGRPPLRSARRQGQRQHQDSESPHRHSIARWPEELGGS